MTYTTHQSDELSDFDEDLSEVELMVLLSGMVGGDFLVLRWEQLSKTAKEVLRFSYAVR